MRRTSECVVNTGTNGVLGIILLLTSECVVNTGTEDTKSQLRLYKSVRNMKFAKES
jgi:hypothetical protein